MSSEIALLARKTTGFIQAIEKMGPDERTKYPSLVLAKDFNHLLQLIEEHAPSLKPFLPPPLKIEKNEYGTEDVFQTFSELLVLVEQVYELLQGLTDTSDAENGNE